MPHNNRRYMYNDPDSGISNARFALLVSLGETVCRSHVADFVVHPEYFYSDTKNLESVVMSMAPTYIGISIKNSKNRAIRAKEEAIVKQAARNLFEEFLSFASGMIMLRSQNEN